MYLILTLKTGIFYNWNQAKLKLIILIILKILKKYPENKIIF